MPSPSSANQDNMAHPPGQPQSSATTAMPQSNATDSSQLLMPEPPSMQTAWLRYTARHPSHRVGLAGLTNRMRMMQTLSITQAIQGNPRVPTTIEEHLRDEAMQEVQASHQRRLEAALQSTQSRQRMIQVEQAVRAVLAEEAEALRKVACAECSRLRRAAFAEFKARRAEAIRTRVRREREARAAENLRRKRAVKILGVGEGSDSVLFQLD
ncbi:hypothetical protein B0T17DRAFT_308895 [Bombardia bombarda]|uniref:Uncharacterized protein n=1 Tax=Bombardia bombarda TaxID=252184 RepID=A0AA39WV33_9PEZI|nr:hypothetical protein B0T17DRAFT_308895 [Bombardia bombarda]